MRWREIMENISSGATGSGSIAVVSNPIGKMITRTENKKIGKYSNSPKPTLYSKKKE